MLQELTSSEFIINTALIMAPAYLANGLAPVFSGGPPLDFGKIFIDHRRILGDGKTTRGTGGALLSGSLGSLAFILVVNAILGGTSYGINHFLLGVIATCGAVIGDLMGAFIKRRLSLNRGARAPVLDQLGFVVFALLFVNFGVEVFPVIQITMTTIVFILFVTFFLHILSNYIGYKIGVKKEPW